MKISDYDDFFVTVSEDLTRYEPSADSWMIEFYLLTATRIKTAPVIKSIKINDIDVRGAAKNIPEQLPINKVDGITKAQLIKWNELRKAQSLDNLKNAQLSEYYKLQKLIGKGIKNPQVIELCIAPRKLPFGIVKGRIYPVNLEIETESGSQRFAVEVYVVSLPSDPGWSPAELHVHSTFSDGRKSPGELKTLYKNKGYKILYMTDHIDNANSSAERWNEYQKVSELSDSSIAIYPGTEMTVNYRRKSGELIHSDILAYGIKGPEGLKNRVYDTQKGIDNILANNPGISSPAIAHPFYFITPWEDWNSKRYRGFEIMSGFQCSFSDEANPMVRWRKELSRLLDETFASGCFASARAGGDYHGFPLRMAIDFVTYIGTSKWNNKYSVDDALYKGRTVASRYGGLAYFTLTHGKTKKEVGDIFTGVARGAAINFAIAFKPVKSGEYFIGLYRDDRAELVYSASSSCSAGTAYDMKGSFQFPGGKHFYWLYVSGPDYIYSSPVFISE
ncbi:MAG: hypothetical protein NUV45_14605 [Tepidanaerobacteraceae bacterium]|nr:hypothetical protein [Tepidanaerobacteraceae bacterium]